MSARPTRSAERPAYPPYRPGDTTFSIARNAGHPLDFRPGWDLMFVEGASLEGVERIIEAAREKFWRLLPESRQAALPSWPSAILYKPSGAIEDWIDISSHVP